MAQSGAKGRKVLPFVGKEQELNHLILELLRVKMLTSYETYQELRTAKGSRHLKNQVVDRRFKALEKEDWIRPVGIKKNKFNQDMAIYQLSPRALTALERDKVDIEEFQLEADDDLQEKMRALLFEYRKRKQSRRQNKN